MTIENPMSTEEHKDIKRRQDLQTALQEALRRSASDSEIRRIQAEIEELNRKIESYASRTRRPG